MFAPPKDVRDQPVAVEKITQSSIYRPNTNFLGGVGKSFYSLFGRSKVSPTSHKSPPPSKFWPTARRKSFSGLVMAFEQGRGGKDLAITSQGQGSHRRPPLAQTCQKEEGQARASGLAHLSDCRWAVDDHRFSSCAFHTLPFGAVGKAPRLQAHPVSIAARWPRFKPA
jgi:hypothetical protein